jgi:hypothetical protein
MAMTVQQMRPVAHVPFVLGVFRRLAGATILDRLLPPHPAPGLSCGRGVAALGRAMRDGDQALSQGGKRWEERGLVALLQPGFTRASRHADRFGHVLEALVAAQLHGGCGAVARTALAVSALPPPWRPQAPTPRAL